MFVILRNRDLISIYIKYLQQGINKQNNNNFATKDKSMVLFVDPLKKYIEFYSYGKKILYLEFKSDMKSWENIYINYPYGVIAEGIIEILKKVENREELYLENPPGIYFSTTFKNRNSKNNKPVNQKILIDSVQALNIQYYQTKSGIRNIRERGTIKFLLFGSGYITSQIKMKDDLIEVFDHKQLNNEIRNKSLLGGYNEELQKTFLYNYLERKMIVLKNGLIEEVYSPIFKFTNIEDFNNYIRNE